MKTLKSTILIALSILVSNVALAQIMKEPVAFKLKNGLQITVSENDLSPRVFASIRFDKAAFENKKDGVLELFNAMLNQWASSTSEVTFADQGAKIASKDEDFSASVQLAATALQNVVLNEEAFRIAKTQILTGLNASSYDFDSSVSIESINNLTLNDVKDFYNQLTPSKIFLTIAGQIKTSEAKAVATNAFGNWTKAAVSSPVYASTK